MTPEQLVPTLETCLRLSKVGFPQDTHFCYNRAERLIWTSEQVLESWRIAAPTLDEILQVLFKQLFGYPELHVLAKTLIFFPNGYEQSYALIGSNRAEVAALLYIQLHKPLDERSSLNPHPTTDEQIAP